jgi:hypothetical protein
MLSLHAVTVSSFPPFLLDNLQHPFPVIPFSLILGMYLSIFCR